MQRGYPLHLRNAAAGQLGRPRNAHACLPEPDDALVERRVRLAAFVPACRFRNLDPFALALANKGAEAAMKADPHLAAGLNVSNGKIRYKAVADALGLPYEPA